MRGCHLESSPFKGSLQTSTGDLTQNSSLIGCPHAGKSLRLYRYTGGMRTKSVKREAKLSSRACLKLTWGCTVARLLPARRNLPASCLMFSYRTDVLKFMQPHLQPHS
eukprot:5498505-Amphidinium_carterae.1